MHKVIFSISIILATTSVALAADPNFNNWNDIEDFNFNIQTRKKDEQQAPTLPVPDHNKPTTAEPAKTNSNLEVKTPPEVSAADIPNPPETAKRHLTPDEQLKEDLAGMKGAGERKTKPKKPVIIKEANTPKEPRRYNTERKSIGKSDPVASFFKENELLEKEFKPDNSETRRVYDTKQAPSQFMQNIKRSEANSHLPNLAYQREFTELLFAAVAKDDVGAISSLLARGADINAKIIDSGVSPLISAIKLNNLRTVRYLLTRGADVNIKVIDGRTPIFFAASANNVNVFNLLLSAGANALMTDNSGKHPLEYVNMSLRPTFELAIAQHSKDKNKALLDFVAIKSLYPVRYLLDEGADINYREESTGDTALIRAVKANNIDMVNLLLARNANIDLANAKGETALKIAQTNRQPQIASVIDTIMIRNELESSSTARKFEPFKAPEPIQVKTAPIPVQLAPIQAVKVNKPSTPWVNPIAGLFNVIGKSLNSVAKEASSIEVKTEKLPELDKQTTIYTKPQTQQHPHVIAPFTPKKLPPNIVKKVIKDGEEVAKSKAGDWVRVPTKEEMQPTSIIPDEFN